MSTPGVIVVCTTATGKRGSFIGDIESESYDPIIRLWGGVLWPSYPASVISGLSGWSAEKESEEYPNSGVCAVAVAAAGGSLAGASDADNSESFLLPVVGRGREKSRLGWGETLVEIWGGNI